MRLRRGIVTAFLIFIFFILQCTVCQSIALAGISPNILLILTSSMGFMRGEKTGMAVGFFSGLLTDIFFGSLFGFFALLYMFLGYGNGMFHMVFYDDDIKLPLVWIALSDLLYGVGVYFFLFLMRSRFDFGYYLAHIILPETVYTVLVTLVLYRIIRIINRALERREAEESLSRASTPDTLGGVEDRDTEEL